MNPIYEKVCKDHGFRPEAIDDRPRREFIAWWYSRGELKV